jgi:hypothetical protein
VGFAQGVKHLYEQTPESVMRRFFDATAATLPHWHQRLFLNEVLAIESGLLTGSNAARLPVRASDVDAPRRETTAPSRPGPDESTIKAPMSSAILLSVAVLGDEQYNQLLRIIVECAEPVEQWHFNQNKFLREPGAGHTFLLHQLQGEFAAHLWERCRC